METVASDLREEERKNLNEKFQGGKGDSLVQEIESPPVLYSRIPRGEIVRQYIDPVVNLIMISLVRLCPSCFWKEVARYAFA
jgi:hypothetical protein